MEETKQKSGPLAKGPLRNPEATALDATEIKDLDDDEYQRSRDERFLPRRPGTISDASKFADVHGRCYVACSLAASDIKSWSSLELIIHQIPFFREMVWVPIVLKIFLGNKYLNGSSTYHHSRIATFVIKLRDSPYPRL